MCVMFYYSEKFDKNISNWNVNKVISIEDMFYNCSIKQKHKPRFLIE